MPRLRCLAGPSLDNLYPISINSSIAYDISSDVFQGKVTVFIKMQPKDKGKAPHVHPNEYFLRPERKGVTWSIQVQGRFLKNYSADDILFGNTFDRPLQLPWGSSAALKFMSIVDPTMEHDLTSSQPWALSPLISTMPYLHHQRLNSNSHSRPLPFPSQVSVSDNTRQLKSSRKLSDRSAKSSGDRRSYFASAKHRKEVVFGPNDIITTDFCYGFLKFPDLHFSLPAGISFDLKKYWDGQPARFVCCERHPDGFQYARMFWCVLFELVDDEDEDTLNGETEPTGKLVL